MSAVFDKLVGKKGCSGDYSLDSYSIGFDRVDSQGFLLLPAKNAPRAKRERVQGSGMGS